MRRWAGDGMRAGTARRRLARGLAVAAAIVHVVAAADVRAVEPTPEVAPAFDLSWNTGFDWSEGDYGLDRDSRLLYVPLGATVDVDAWRLRVTLPFLYSRGVVGAVGAPTELEQDEKVGLGEAISSVSYLFSPLAEGLPWIELAGQVSWPTRTARALGTGRFAFAAQVDAFQQLGDWTPFARFGRNFFLVDSLSDRFYASVGTSYRLTERVSAGVAYDWRGRAVSGVRDAHELVPYASYALGDAWRLGPYGVVGLSSGSPDYGVGLSIQLTR